jgi:hypothetical protein
MRIYETEFRADEWDVACTLELKEDGRFEYGEYWTCYLAATGGDVRGSWSQEGDAVVLRADWCQGATFLRLPFGEERRAEQAGGALVLGDRFTFRLRTEAPAEPSPVPPPDTVPPPVGAPAAWAPAATSAAAAPPATRELVGSPEALPAAGLRVPSPQLAARMRELVAEFPARAANEGTIRLCRASGMLPLATNSIYLWGLRPDGVMLCVDHESSSQRAEVETDPVAAYGAMMQGVQRYPELQPLIPQRPPGVVRCDACDGRGYIRQPGQRIADECLRCAALGWHFSRAAADAEPSSA